MFTAALSVIVKKSKSPEIEEQINCEIVTVAYTAVEHEIVTCNKRGWESQR